MTCFFYPKIKIEQKKTFVQVLVSVVHLPSPLPPRCSQHWKSRSILEKKNNLVIELYFLNPKIEIIQKNICPDSSVPCSWHWLTLRKKRCANKTPFFKPQNRNFTEKHLPRLQCPPRCSQHWLLKQEFLMRREKMCK